MRDSSSSLRCRVRGASLKAREAATARPRGRRRCRGPERRRRRRRCSRRWRAVPHQCRSGGCRPSASLAGAPRPHAARYGNFKWLTAGLHTWSPCVADAVARRASDIWHARHAINIIPAHLTRLQASSVEVVIREVFGGGSGCGRGDQCTARSRAGACSYGALRPAASPGRSSRGLRVDRRQIRIYTR